MPEPLYNFIKAVFCLSMIFALGVLIFKAVKKNSDDDNDDIYPPLKFRQ